MKLLIGGCLICLLSAGLAAIPDPVNPDPQSPRIIAGVDTIFTEEMTWMEIRDALQAGKTTIIISTGGVEQNGPYLVTGKHNLVLRATTESIARKLGDALVAPIIPFVPEGTITPPSEHMKYPGTISVTDETFDRLITEICQSFKQHGFKKLVLIGDSGGNQKGMQAVATRLAQEWKESDTKIAFIPEYFNWPKCEEYLKQKGIVQEPQGLHDDFQTTAILTAVDPLSVRFEQRVKAGHASINGVSLVPQQKTVELGKELIEFRANAAVAGVRKAFSE